MNKTMNPIPRLSLRRAAAAALLALVAGSGLAQQDKAVAIESVPAFPAFSQWVGSYVVVVPEAAVASVRPVRVAPWEAAPAGSHYEPWPVILGEPEIPLLGAGARRAAQAWGAGFNYQGVHMRQVVLNARGTQRELRSMAVKPRAGERFKVRVTATFDAVADVDLVGGKAWALRRIGQFYPAQGQSVEIKAGQSVDLPLGENEYFVMDRPADEQLVVSVRHARALGTARSSQPAYREDGRNGSHYLQLAPAGSYPAIEQLIVQAR